MPASHNRSVVLYWTPRLEQPITTADFATARLPYHNPTWGETLRGIAVFAACVLFPPVMFPAIVKAIITPWPKFTVPSTVPSSAAKRARKTRRLEPPTIDMPASARWQADTSPQRIVARRPGRRDMARIRPSA